MGLVGEHLSGLATFRGRENRRPFWLWMLIVWGVQVALGAVASTVLMSSVFGPVFDAMTRNQGYLNEHPEAATAMMVQAMVPMMRDMMAFSAVTLLIAVVFVGAAVTRRLHDGGRSGWWAAPLPVLQVALLAIYATVMPKFFAAVAAMRPGMRPEDMNAAMMPMMQAMQLPSLLGMASAVLTILLVVFLALPGTEGSNRYGEDPLDGPPLPPHSTGATPY